MTMKPKIHETPDAAAVAAPIPLSKINEVHRHLQHATNILRLADLAANELIDGDIQGNEDYLHAIASASHYATKSIETAYDMIDQFDYVDEEEAA
jgi:hypothetical protein